jgi:hypothetical protein
MQNYCKTIGALAAASALAAGTAMAEVEYEIHTGYTSEYLFRGTDLGNDLTEVGLDAATTYNDINFSAGLWAAAFNTTGTANQIDSEVDFYGEVSKDFGFATLGLGYIYYWNMGQLGADAQEVYFTASRDLGFAEAYLTYFWDVDGDNDGYTELGFSRGWELNQCLTVNVDTNFGYFCEGHEFGSWTTKVGLDWGFTETATLTPFVALAVDLGDKAGLEDEFVAGTMLAVSF